MRWWHLALLVMPGCKACDRCQPDLPDTQNETDDDSDTDPLVDPDTDPPPCDFPEIEPNNAFDQATPIPLETLACGTIDPLLDTDQWAFTLLDPTWLEVDVHSTSIGSIADVALVLSREQGGSVESRDRADGEQDVTLVFPALDGDYQALIVDEGGLGGSDDYFYELLVTEAKQPVEWNVPSDDVHDAVSAQIVDDGDVVFGTIGTPSEGDWYAIPIPADTSSVELWVEGRVHGSPADTTLQLYDEDVDLIRIVPSGPDGGPDPWLEEFTDGDTTWYVRVTDLSGRSGSAYWYTLFVVLKGD